MRLPAAASPMIYLASCPGLAGHRKLAVCRIVERADAAAHGLPP
jgi:hypothetical protein